MSVRVNPEILVWARESAGLALEDAAEKLNLLSSQRSSAAEKLAALESGKKEPTRGQLNAFASVYKRPLVMFYLAEPPRKGDRGQDFRQTPESRGPRDNAMLDALLRDVKARQEIVRDLLLEDDNLLRPDFVGSASIRESVIDVVRRIATRMSFDHTNPVLRSGDTDDLFRRLRKSAEEIGIFVLVLGDLGSHHTAILPTVFRGFAIADPIAPFIVINAKEARPARAFTLIHEMAHIWLGQTGVSGDVAISLPISESAKYERFCNDVASEFLLPERNFRQPGVKFHPTDIEGARASISLISSRWSVSEPMVAYRFQRSGELTPGTYETLRLEYHQRWVANLERERQRRLETDNNPSGYTIKQFYLGNALVDLVNRGYQEKNLSHTKAATLLGSKAISVPGFLSSFEDKRRKLKARSGDQA